MTDLEASRLRRNLALVQVENSFLSHSLYGFQIQVKNPTEMSNGSWEIFTLSKSGQSIDGVQNVHWDSLHVDGTEATSSFDCLKNVIKLN